MSKAPVTTQEVVDVYLQEILLPNQIRKDFGDVEAFAKNLGEHGLLEPVVLSRLAEPGPKGEKYLLHAGARRVTALRAMKWRKPVLAVFRETTDPLGVLVDTYTENQERKDVTPLELGQTIVELLSGTFVPYEGQEPLAAVSKDEIALRFGLSKNRVGEFARLHKSLHEDVREAAIEANLPERQVQMLASIKTDDKEQTGKKQTTALQRYIQKQEDLKKAGRVRNTRSDKGKTVEDARPIVSLTKKIGPLKAPSLRRSVDDYMLVLRRKLEGKISSAEVRHRLDGMLLACRFFTGDLTKFPEITVDDFKELDEARELAAAAEAGDEAAAE